VFQMLNIQVLLSQVALLNSFLFISVNPEDFSVVLWARKNILEAEEITVSYVPSFYGIPKRKLNLANEWYFDCSCARCSDVTEFGTFVSALKCGSCREGLILPEDKEKGLQFLEFKNISLLYFQDPSGDAGSVQILTRVK
jgi:hypothetical protein